MNFVITPEALPFSVLIDNLNFNSEQFVGLRKQKNGTL
jgi:hypothetical protein